MKVLSILFTISIILTAGILYAETCFEAHDLNSNGLITPEEFRKTQQQLEECLDTVPRRRNKFIRLDRNSDRKLSIHEFQKCPPRHHHCKEKNRMFLFEYLSGKDNYISMKEYTACPPVSVDILFKLYDLNGNGSITSQEKDDSNNGTM